MTALKTLGVISYILGYLILPVTVIEDHFFPLDESVTYSATFNLYILYWLIGIFPSFAWYDCTTEDGIIIKRFAYTKIYTWE